MYASSQLLKRRLNAVMPAESLEYSIKGIKVNGKAYGCSGFIRNKVNNVVVYVNTEVRTVQHGKTILIRYAKDFKDYTGCFNRYTDEDNFARDAMQLLTNQEAWLNELTKHR